MKSRKHEKGQAIAELTIGMVGIMTVFLGLLFVSALGIENIENLITARGEADAMSYSGTIGDSGQHVTEWDFGNDELYFTADDTPTTSSFIGDSGKFSNELASTNGAMNFTEPVNFDGSSITTDFASLSAGNLFHWAAMLTSHTQTEEDPLGERNLEDLRGALNNLINYDLNITLSETVYMPRVTN